jgi:Flp pilus assembly protein TadD
MARKKTSRYLRRQAITAAFVISLALALVVVIATPDLRSRLNSGLNSSANFFLFDDDVTETEEASEEASNEAAGEASPDGKAAGPKRSSGFKRVVTAPVRLFARLFRGKSTNDIAMKNASEKDIEKMRVIPMNRSQNGVIADAGPGTAPEATATEIATKRHFEEAMALRDKGRSDGAIEKLVTATILQPNFAEAFNLLAVCYDEKGQYRAAQDEYKKALKLEPNNARFLNNIGYSFYLANDFGSAIKYYGKGLKITPNDRRMHNNIGLAYGRKGEYDKARRHFVIAVGETGAELNLGYVFSQQGKYDEAIFHYEAALTTQPQSLTALGNLVSLYERTGRMREAAQLSERYKRLAVAAQQKEQAVDQQQ